MRKQRLRFLLKSIVIIIIILAGQLPFGEGKGKQRMKLSQQNVITSKGRSRTLDVSQTT